MERDNGFSRYNLQSANRVSCLFKSPTIMILQNAVTYSRCALKIHKKENFLAQKTKSPDSSDGSLPRLVR